MDVERPCRSSTRFENGKELNQNVYFLIGGVSLRNFYALRTAFDVVDRIERLDAVGEVTVESEIERSVLFDIDTTNILIA
jgi:hypothetical protein